MALRIAQVTLLNGVTSVIKAFPTGIKGYLIGNESGFTCDVQLENGDEKILYPGTVDWFDPGPSFSGIIFVRPSINIQTAILYPSQTVFADAVAPNDNIDASAYPMALPRPMTAGSTSPQSGFSAYVVFTIPSVAANRFMMNIFNNNSIGSGIIARLFSLQIKHNGIGVLTSNLSIRTDGTDNNFPNVATINTHNIGGAASQNMHVTFANNTVIPAQNVFVASTIIDDNLYDYAGPPDAYYLNPKQNYTMDVQGAAANSFVFMTMKWTEQ